MAKIDMAKFAKFCKDNGFIFQSSEIYGGINGFWDYGPLGVELKKNIKDAWWLDMVRNPPPGPDGQEIRMVGLDCSIIMNPKVWVASGHVGSFADPMVECKETGNRYRVDQLSVLTPEKCNRTFSYTTGDGKAYDIASKKATKYLKSHSERDVDNEMPDGKDLVTVLKRLGNAVLDTINRTCNEKH